MEDKTVQALAKAVRYSAPDSILAVADALAADPATSGFDRVRFLRMALASSPFFTLDETGRAERELWIEQHATPGEG